MGTRLLLVSVSTDNASLALHAHASGPGACLYKSHFQFDQGCLDLAGPKTTLLRQLNEIVLGVSALEQHVTKGPLRQPRINCAAAALPDVAIDIRERCVFAKVGNDRLAPGRRTRCASLRASIGSEKFLKAAEEYTKSNDSSGNGMADALPPRKSTSTPALRALSVAIATKVRLMSKPAM